MRKLWSFILGLALSLSIFTGCVNNDSGNDKVLATAHGENLYLSEVRDIFVDDLSPEDSLQMLVGYIDRWVRKQLLLNKAEKNLTDNQKDVSKQIDDYRSSLLIFKYEQEFIRQKLDTVISDEEIERFYTENSSNFILSEGIVKALFIKIRMDDPYYDKIKALYKSQKEEDVQSLDNMAYQVALKYDYFNDKWIPFSRIVKELPEKITDPEQFLRYNRSIDMNDGTHSYLVSLRDVIHKGEQSPLSYETQNIKSIILNKRRQKLVQDLETNIYNDAKNYNHFEIYID